MSVSSSGWSDLVVAGHRCEVYEPAECNAAGWVLVYLHGVHQGSLRDQAPYTDLFAQFGLPVVAPMCRTDLVDQSDLPSFR